MGTVCSISSGIHPDNSPCSALKELIPVKIRSETKFVNICLSSQEIVAIKVSWANVKPVWDEICAMAFKR